MRELMRWANNQGVEPVRPTALSKKEERVHSRALTRIEHVADLQIRAVELEAEVGQAKVQAIANVANAAMTAQAIMAGRERLLVESEPAAIHGVVYLSQKLTLSLGVVLDDVVREVTR